MNAPVAPIHFITPAGQSRQTGLYGIALTPDVSAMLAADAVCAMGVSGGKDSIACALRLDAYLNEIGHTGPRVLVHADLGSVEWKDSLPVCERLAAQIGWELVVVRRKSGDMMERWEQRWAANMARYSSLECVKVILPWSTPSWRFCTSELKTAVINAELKRRYAGKQILSVTGVRHQESAARAKMPTAKVNERLSKPGAEVLDWNAIIEWTTDEVFDYIREQNGPLHEAYTVYGSSRVSCVACIMGSIGDLRASASCPDNHDIFRRMVELEANSTFGLQGSRWLGDVVPHLLPVELSMRLQDAKELALQREAAEARIPKHLLYTSGYPSVLPTFEEASLLAEVRQTVARLLQVEIGYTEPNAIIERFAELMAEARAKGKLAA